MDTVKLSGNMTSFRTPLDVPIRSLKVHFSPIQAGSGDPSPSNVRAISGWTGVDVYKYGKNLLSTKDENDYYPIFIKSGTTLTASSASIGTSHDTMERIRYYDKNKNQIDWWTISDGVPPLIGNRRMKTFTTLQDTYYVKFDKNYSPLQLEYGSTVTAYEPYQQQTIPVSFGENGTIYGGYVDLISGELVKEWVYDTINSNDWNNVSTDGTYKNVWQWGHSKCQMTTTSTWNRVYCKCTHWYNNRYANEHHVLLNNNGALYIGKDFWEEIGVVPTQENIIAYFQQQANAGTPLYFCGLLATPITYQLTPQQLNAFLGYNNIWSDADSVEVEYDLVETADIIMTRKRLILNEPHIQTLIGNPASFSTDMRGLLKSCKIGFNPVQEGSGDPSPNNVRAISGWTGVTVNRTGKNLFNWDVPRSHASPIASANTTARTFELNTYVVGMSSGNYYRDDTTNWVPSFSVSNGVISFTSGGASGYGIAYVMNLVPGDYFVSCEKTGSGSVDITYYDSDGNYMSRQGDRRNKTFTVPSDTKTTLICFSAGVTNSSFTFSNVQIEIASSATTYEPYQGNEIPISWQSEIGTLYGGYIDLLNGELVATHQKLTFDGSKQWNFDKMPSYDNNRVLIHIGTISGAELPKLVTQLPPFNYLKTSDQPRGEWQGYISSAGNVAVRLPTSIDSASAWSNYLAENPLEVVYELATPITYQLTPQIIRTLKGINNIWSDAGDVTIKYWKH